MSDIEKFKKLFDEIGIKYHYMGNSRTNHATLKVDEEYIYMSYGNAVEINFELNSGKFTEFEVWGE